MARGRTLTVLIADVVGSSDLFGRLGVDRADNARRALFAAFSTAISTGDGVLIKTMGDGCLASFDSATDAVTAAVAMQHAVAGLREHRVPGLGLRVGIAVGDVTEEDGDVFGPAVVVASRLCGAADEHQVLVTDMVRMLAGDRGGHHYETVGDLALKGVADPVPACAIGIDAASNTARPFPSVLAATPAEQLVGRDRELAALTAAWKAAAEGTRRAVLVTGEPGVGKTRLAATVARRAHDEGALVLFGRCEEDLAVPYQPFAEALRAGLPGLDAEVLRAHVAEHGGEIRRLVPVIAAAEPVRADPAVEQVRLFDAVTDLLHRAADDRPVVLVLDDLHWAASATIALLRHLLNAAPDHSLCVLGTYRDTEVDHSHPLGGLLTDIHRVSGVERLALSGLDDHSVEELLVGMSGDDVDDQARALAAGVVARTAGNPFFANQMLRHLVERGILVQIGARWMINGSLDDVDLPDGVLDVVGRRLSRLSPAANSAVAVAAICGLEFGARVLCEVPDAGTPHAVVDGLDEAARARLLIETGPGHFAFIHAIVRDALLRRLTVAKRARLHRAVGEAILAVYGEAAGVPVAELARHFTEAAVLGDTAAAARWATAAAAAAADQADHRGAIAVLERALAVIEDVEPVDQVARFDVAAALAERHYVLAETDPASVGSAVDVARRLGSGERMLRIAMAARYFPRGVADPEGLELYTEALRLLDPAAVPLRALATASRAYLRSVQGGPGFIDDVEAAQDLVADIGSTAPRVAAAARLRIANATMGLPGAAHRLRLCDDALAVAPDAADPWWAQLGTGINDAVQLRVLRGHALIGLGRRAEFETNRARIMELSETVGNALPRIMVPAGAALLALLDGRFHDVAASADRMLEAAPDEENVRLTHFRLSAHVALEEGRSAELAPLWENVLAESPQVPVLEAEAGRARLESGDRTGANDALATLAGRWSTWARDWTWHTMITAAAELVAGLDATEHAQMIVDELEPYAGELAIMGRGVLCAGAFDRYRGMLLSLLGRHDEAVAALMAALALEEAVESPPLTARTRYWLARALLRRGGPHDRERGAMELERSVRTAEGLGMVGLERAGRELGERGT